MTDVLLCVGNSMMGDDGAGPLLAQMCAENPQGNWRVIDGGSAPENDVVAIRELRPTRLLIVDATDMGLNPGEMRIVDPDDIAEMFLILSMAMTDLLTGMPNSRGFYRSGEKRFAWLKEHKKDLSLLYFSIDNLKSINELLGNKEGDEVVKIFASNMTKCLKDQDIAARLSGGEFAVLLANTPTHNADAFLFDLQSRIDAIDHLSGKNYHINYSHGIIENGGDKYTTLRGMLEDCDKVMYSEKRRR